MCIKSAVSLTVALVSKVFSKMDQKLSLSSHIIDTTKGKPADNVSVKLYKLVGGIWVESISNGVTDKDGRIKEFSKIDGASQGVYKLRFAVAEYFARLGQETLYPFVEVRLVSKKVEMLSVLIKAEMIVKKLCQQKITSFRFS